MANEVKTYFTVDLSAYLTGLKTMLTMTQQAGVQLKPLLNLQIDKANFAEIDKTFDEYLAKIKESVPAEQGAAAAAAAVGVAHEEVEKKVKRASVAQGEHEVSLKKSKREALEAYGATMFLVQGVLRMADSATGGSKEMEKLNRAMSEGVGQGFELAGLLGMLGVASGGTAVVIGALATIAVTLMRVFGDVADVTERNKRIQEDFSMTMRGTSAAAWDAYITQLRIAAEETRRQLEIERARHQVWGENIPLLGLVSRGIHNLIFDTKDLNAAEEQNAIVQDTLKTALKERATLTKSVAEIQQFTEQARLDSITNANQREIAEARKTYQEEIAMIQASSAQGIIRDEALAASREKLRVKIEQILIQERQQSEQAAKAIRDAYLQADEQRFEAELNRFRTVATEQGAVAEQIDLQIIQARLARYRGQLNELAKVVGPLSPEQLQKQLQLEGQITQLELTESQKRITIKQNEKNQIAEIDDIDFQATLMRLQLRGVMQGKSDEQIAVEVLNRKRMRAEAEHQLLLDSETAGVQLDEKEKLRKAQLENEITDLVFQGVTARMELRRQEEEAIQSGLQSIFSDLSSMSSSLVQLEQQRTSATIGEEKKRKQAELDANKERALSTAKTEVEKSKVEKKFATEKEQLDADMEEKARSMNKAAFERWKALEKANTLISTYSSAQKAYESLVGIPVVGPALGTIAAAAAVAAGLARVAVINAQGVPGLAKGAKIESPTLALVGEAGTEYVMPASFVKSDLLPQIKETVLMALASANTGQGIIIQINIEKYYGDEEHFEKVLKPTLEDAMRRAGTNNVASLFVNPKRQ